MEVLRVPGRWGAGDGGAGAMGCRCRRYLLRRRLPSARPPRGLTRRALSVPVGDSMPGASSTAGTRRRDCRGPAPSCGPAPRPPAAAPPTQTHRPEGEWRGVSGSGPAAWPRPSPRPRAGERGRPGGVGRCRHPPGSPALPRRSAGSAAVPRAESSRPSVPPSRAPAGAGDGRGGLTETSVKGTGWGVGG